MSVMIRSGGATDGNKGGRTSVTFDLERFHLVHYPRG